MSKRSIAIGMMLVPALVAWRAQDPGLVDRSTADVVVTDASALAHAPPGAVSDVCVPFKANGSAGSVQIAGGPPPAPLTITLSAGGQATHLGRYSSSASFVVTFPSPMAALFDGGGTFTAANGDELYFTYSGDFFPGPVAGGLGVYEFVGGTGRFESARGSGVFRSDGGDTTFDGDVCFAR